MITIPDAYRRYRPVIRGAWVVSVLLEIVNIGLGATRIAPHWVFVAVLALGVFLVSGAYAKRNDAVMLELGEAGAADGED
jgi:hypothetical protein